MRFIACAGQGKRRSGSSEGRNMSDASGRSENSKKSLWRTHTQFFTTHEPHLIPEKSEVSCGHREKSVHKARPQGQLASPSPQRSYDEAAHGASPMRFEHSRFDGAREPRATGSMMVRMQNNPSNLRHRQPCPMLPETCSCKLLATRHKNTTTHGAMLLA